MAYTGLQSFVNKTAGGMNQAAATKTAAPAAPSVSLNAVGNASAATKPATKLQEVSAYNAPAGSKVNANVVDAVLAKNFDKGDPNLVTGEQLKTAEQKGQIDPSLGNLLSSNAALAKGAAALGVTKKEVPLGMTGQKETVYGGDLNAAAKALGIDLTPYKKTVTGGMGAKQTVLDKNAAYNAINEAANQAGMYAITEREPGTTGSGKNAVHTTTLYTNQGGTLQPFTDQTGKPVTSSFKSNTFTSDPGFFGGIVEGLSGIASEMSPILLAMGVGNGLSKIVSGIANAGVGTATLDAASSSFGDLVARNTSSIFTDIAKDIGSTIFRSEVSKKYGPLAGNVAGIGLNYAGLTSGGLNKGLVSGFDVGDISDAIEETPINQVGTGASGFPVNEGLYGPEPNINYIDTSGVQYDQYGNPSTKMPEGSYVDSSGNVYDEMGNPTGNLNIGGKPGSDLTGILGAGGGVISLNDAIDKINAAGGVPDFSKYSGGGTSGGGGVGGGGSSGGTFGGGGGGTNPPIDWTKVFDKATLASLLGSAGQGAASIYAADKQYQAAKYAADLQKQMFDIINLQYAPQRGAGYQALGQIRSMLPGQYQKYDEQGKPIGTATGTDYLTRQFTPQDLYAGLAPNYNFMLQQGQQVAQRQGNVSGGGLGGNVQRALQEYTQNYAGNAYQNAFQNFQNQRSNIYNTLAGIAGIGQTAQNTTSQAGQNMATNVGQLAVGGAGAQAAGITGAANAIAGGAQNYGANQILQAILGQNQNVAQGGGVATPPFNPA